MQIVGESSLLNAPLHVLVYTPVLTRTQLLCPSAVISLWSHPHAHPHSLRFLGFLGFRDFLGFLGFRDFLGFLGFLGLFQLLYVIDYSIFTGF